MADAAVLFDDIFDVVRVNPEGRKFDRVNRLVCKGEAFEADLIIDIASEVYQLREGDKFTLTLAGTLRLDGKPDEDYFNQDGQPTLLDQYEYGMCGKTFKYDHEKDNRVSVIASFGGLLMQISGEQRHLARLRIDQKVYALMRKTAGGKA